MRLERSAFATNFESYYAFGFQLVNIVCLYFGNKYQDKASEQAALAGRDDAVKMRILPAMVVQLLVCPEPARSKRCVLLAVFLYRKSGLIVKRIIAMLFWNRTRGYELY